MGFIPKHGGFENLLSYRKASIVFEGTFRFCERFLKKGDRTHDQMVQAARSGKQNIAEGSVDSGTSKEMEIKLTNCAKGSLVELLGDYQNFISTRKLRLWDADCKEALYVRRLGANKGASYEDFRKFVETKSSEVVANIMVCLIHQATYLLSRQIDRLEADFLNQGGLRERMTRARLEVRNGERAVAKRVRRQSTLSDGGR